MLFSKKYRNQAIHTEAGVVDFDREGKATATPKLEKQLSTSKNIELIEEKKTEKNKPVEASVVEKKKAEQPKKAPAKKTPAKKTTAKKEN